VQGVRQQQRQQHALSSMSRAWQRQESQAASE
jgi:hypothetical protein